ncbi:MAG: type II secretion system F family protein, partial [Planctomycetes bacterium]|nr:type II secretion system F family protein [Planctomycetota bacterium]
MLHSGVHIVKAFEVVGGKSRNQVLRVVSKSIINELRKGKGVAAAMQEHQGRFPDLMLDLVNVAEQTGSLPEVLKSLADHYDNMIRLKRTFVGAIAMPIFQLFAAVNIVAFLIWILGIINSGPNKEAVDVLGLGLIGTRGALMWLFICFGTAFVLFVAYQLLSRMFRGQAMLHSILLRIPVVGGCMRSFAMARFSWAFALTQQAGMPISPSLTSSLKATANGAFVNSSPMVVALVNEGVDLSESLKATGLFPEDYLELVRVGETTGTVPETLDRLSPQLEDQARRSLA